MNPLWLYTTIAGVNKSTGEVFLGTTDMYGLKLEQDFVLTGLALHYGQVLMTNAWRPDMTEIEAKQLLAQVLTVLFYRDKKALDTVQFSVLTKEGIKMDDPVQINSNWDLDFYKNCTNEFWRPMRCKN